MDTLLEVTPRETFRKGPNRKSRAKGSVPAVVYGPAQPARSISIDPTKLTDLFKHTGDRNTIVQIKVGESAPVPCLVREVQRHPVGRQILHVDFFAVPQEEELEVVVPINPVGRPVGAQAGGRLRVIRRELRVRCRYDRIPSKVDIDVSPLDIGGFIRASQIPTPEGVSLVYDHDFNVVSVYGKRAKADAPAAG